MKLKKHTPGALNKGFTLIEILVVVGILGVIGAIATDIFVNVSRSYNKASIMAEVERNGNIALSQMAREIRNARSVVSPDPGVSGSEITIVNAQGSQVTFSFVPETASDNGYVARNDNPLTDSAYSSGVNVTSLNFSVADTDPRVVTITLSISQPLGASSRVDFQAETTLETTVSLRTYE